ncbi:MAG: hypothetical protein L0Z62_03535 [Gemmataceae bacterium]|nr:hypothetical protein [Gemmataceae bacterium]
MSTQQETLPKEMTPQETAVILKRILDAVEEEKRKRWVEITCAFVLALATMGSAWCAYQSTLWGGVQTFRLAAAGRAGRGATQHALAALQLRAADAQLALAYTEARGRGDEKLAEFLRERFRPEAKIAFDAWLKTDPFNNPSAPMRPFEMKEYVQSEMQESKRLDEEAARMHNAAHEANQTSDTYVLLTVLFASVLFFGGIGGTFQSRRLRIMVSVIALVLFVVSLIALGSMPICKE